MRKVSNEELSKMTRQELEALQQEWYAQAREEHIFSMCYRIGKFLGEAGPNQKWLWGHPTVDIKVFVDDEGSYLTVRHNGKLVCTTHPNSQLCVPGKWIAELQAIYEVAEITDDLERKRIEEEKRVDLMNLLVSADEEEEDDA